MKIAIVVLHYRNLADTLECLQSLAHQDYPDVQVFVVDNGAHDPELECALKKYSFTHYIKNEKNLGFAEGNNRGIQAALQAGAEGILLFNNDAVATSTLVSAFVFAAKQHPEAAVFGAKILYYDQPSYIWHAGGSVDMKSMRCSHLGCPDSDLDGKWDAVREIEYACGCALFIKKEAINRVGLMAPEFFLLWEEIDWCYRIRAAGFKILYIPEAKAFHKISRSFEGGNRGPLWQYYYFRNRLLFMKRNLSWKQRLTFYLTHFPKEISQILFFSFNPKINPHQKALNRSALKGILNYFLKH